jgi:hypothetical protein
MAWPTRAASIAKTCGLHVDDDSFFAGIDSILSRKRAAQKAFEAQAADGPDFLGTVIQRLAPLASSNEAKLRERGIEASCTVGESAICFKLTYSNGEYREVVLSCYPSDNRTLALGTFHGSSSQKHTELGKTYNKITWNDGLYEQALQKAVKEFLLSASRHRGI